MSLLFLILLAWKARVHPSSLPLADDSLTGVTSVHRISPHELLIGTKRGTIQRVQVANNGTIKLLEALETNDDSASPTRPFPIYSMASDGSGKQLFSGGGDRYVTVWEKGETQWKRTQRLGPHTGWVKAVLFNQDTHFLHSIGCNFIESWKQNNDKQHWCHWKKSSIESDPSGGATLSSDLLCLCPWQQGMFFAGGVDGRIHVWDSQRMGGGAPVSSIAAHGGRVNAMAYATQPKLLFSVSHDGILKCWSFSMESTNLLVTPLAEMSLGRLENTPCRITSVACIRDTTTESQIVFGTQTGSIYLASALLRPQGVQLELLAESQLGDEPVVNALCLLPSLSHDASFFSVVVGHSLGLTTILYNR